MLKAPIILAVLSCSIHAALAQGAVYSQCGGIGWTGATTCISGSVCVVSNPYYSQCLPGTSTASSTSTKSTTASSSTTTTSGGSNPSKGPNYWFSFGDSYTATGFSISGNLPSTANPIGNPTYPGTTVCPGETWVEYAATHYNASQTYLYNFAVSGATIDSTLVTPYGSSTMTQQIDQFISSLGSKPAKTPWTSSNALFSFFIGINDIGATFTQSGDREAFNDKLLAAYFTLVQNLIAPNFLLVSNTGARNFLFVNVPPTDRSPLIIGEGTGNQATMKAIIAGYNTKLAAKISAFKSSNPQAVTYLYNSNAQFTTILNSPASYGFMDATSFGTGSNLFWCNNLHPATNAHALFGKQVGQTVLSGTIF